MGSDGAGERNRTVVMSMGNSGSAIELHPLRVCWITLPDLHRYQPIPTIDPSGGIHDNYSVSQEESAASRSLSKPTSSAWEAPSIFFPIVQARHDSARVAPYRLLQGAILGAGFSSSRWHAMTQIETVSTGEPMRCDPPRSQ
jgi:hypothetical protein